MTSEFMDVYVLVNFDLGLVLLCSFSVLPVTVFLAADRLLSSAFKRVKVTSPTLY